MSWFSPQCEKSFSRKHSMKRHISNRHSNPGHFSPFYAMHYSAEKCHRFRFELPFTCMVAGMTGSGKTVWVQSLLTSSRKDSVVLPTVAVSLFSVFTCQD